MDNQTPIIVFSGPHGQSGQTTLAINLAAALWYDGYDVVFMPQKNYLLKHFLSQRKILCDTYGLSLYTPKVIYSLQNLTPSDSPQALIADIPHEQWEKYSNVFNQAHTVISVINSHEDINRQADDAYLNFIWNVKKHHAAQGQKYLNWIVVAYCKSQDQKIDREKLLQAQKRYGFRLAPIIEFRPKYNQVMQGFCSSEMLSAALEGQMSLQDVYARREILELADFIWTK